MTALPPRQPTALEIASGLVLEHAGALPRLPEVPSGTTPTQALEAAIVPALQRSPCLVSFSGGRDSSAVLATAVAVARREGLPEPIPISYRFPGASGTDETAWQEMVVRHLGLDEWQRIDLTSELEAIGPVATAVIERHGLPVPCNNYFHAPIFEAASGGSVLTGIGGDEAFLGSTWDHAVAVLSGHVRPVPRDVLRVGIALAPLPVKRAFIRRRLPEFFPWLQPVARQQVEDWIVAESASDPLRYRRRLRRLLASPATRIGLAGLETLAADWDVAVSHPLHDAGFLGTLGTHPSEHRRRSRTEAMEALIGDRLPPEVMRRSTKSRFNEVLWGPRSLELAASWDGDGVDPSVVDIDYLRQMWAEPLPHTQTIMLLQSVWWSRVRAGADLPRAGTPSHAGG